MALKGLIAGLGNPGPRYAGTRHNCGFMFIDRLLARAEKDGSVEKASARKFHAEAWTITLPGLDGPWLAVKPLTFMNDSGAAIKPLLAAHNLAPYQLVAAQDELDIPPGALRFKFGGGLAGHNGLASIKASLGTPDFYRLRIGIGKPPLREEVIDWVLSRPDPAAREAIHKALPIAVESFLVFCSDGLGAASRYLKTAQATE